MSSSPSPRNGSDTGVLPEPHLFMRNNPYDRHQAIQFVVPKLMESKAFMSSIRDFKPLQDSIAIWFLGQNGFILKSANGPLIGIDLYLTNSCSLKFSHLPYRLDRQLPVFIEPEDLDVDVFITTHSHDDHADPETLRRMNHAKTTAFVGPYDSNRVYRECGIPESCCQIIHPGESVDLGDSTTLQATFALPTDSTDLNHIGLLIRFANGITFYDTGDTAYAERLADLLPADADICAICINGGFHNLSHLEAASIISKLQPRVVIPCHYDMMINNVASPEMLRVALDLHGSNAAFKIMKYYEPWLYRRA
jgi:L-ascorbate 6-phosphate lactonase